MLPLAGPPLPDSAESLTRALRDGLARHGIAVREVAASGAWPALDSLRLDFTGLALTRAQRLPVAKTAGEGRIEVADFAVIAAPLRFESTPIDLSLRATQAAFAFSQSADGESMLALTDAAHGDLALEVRRDALESLLHDLASDAAGEHGVDVKKTRIEVAARSPRELVFRAEVTAKMFIATATVTLDGEISVDDQLDARLSNLRFGGEGMIANAAGGFIRPSLTKLEGRTFPLMAFSLGSIKLRDLQLCGGDSLRLTAQFGNDSSPRVIS
jgi:hypothetical protein